MTGGVGETAVEAPKVQEGEKRLRSINLDGHFTRRIKSFFQDMSTWPWDERFPGVVFIRDHTDLPDRSPLDIDLLVDGTHQESLSAYISERANACGLYSFIGQGGGGFFVLLFDLDPASPGRAWAFLEGRDRLVVTKERAIEASDIAVDRATPNGLPAPTQPWSAFLLLVQGARTGKFDKAARVLASQKLSVADAGPLCESILGVSKRQCPNGTIVPQELRQELSSRVVIQPEKPPQNLSLRTRLARWVFRSAYFPHLSAPYFFTIHGPDGVGKSTTCTAIKSIFERLPLQFDSFHHITGWKHSRQAAAKSAGLIQRRPVSPLRKALRLVYRFLPETLRQVWVLGSGYHLYLTQINKHIYARFVDGKILLVDRYIYDNIVRLQLKSPGFDWMHSIFSRLARRPRTAYLLTDKPENIRRRKQELSHEELVRYPVLMEEELERRSIPTETVSVDGRPPAELARVIVSDMLDRCGPDLFNLFRGSIR